ncbi:Putative ATP-dependent Zn protease [Nitrosotalea devaniterrae]|uniref:ATP-dependent Zn protease n=1 Tax=Nitrosotalea devaniterrae TaxID=1078905 RepID=A0A128A417_9ARCH|nr:Putative ATP-dependent Zn protease [Candidatus Nitrosotalea devanaterra]
MPKEPDDPESEIIKQMFEEIMKMIREKQIRLESIVQRTLEHGTIQQESFNRTYRLLTEYGKTKQWLPT